MALLADGVPSVVFASLRGAVRCFWTCSTATSEGSPLGLVVTPNLVIITR